MKALTFSLRLLEPLLATQPHSAEANSAISFSFIPGSMLRGALIAAYTHRWGGDEFSINKEARQLFFDGDVCFLNAYPLYTLSPIKKIRMLPTPLSWFEEKETLDDDQATISDFAVEVNNELKKPKSTQKGDFCYLSDETAYLMTPSQQLNIHNASTNRNQKSKNESQVYRYQAIAAGNSFAGVIVAESEVDLSKLKCLLEEIVVLGGSHTGGYGRVVVSDIKEESNWKEYTPGKAIANTIIITLLSDTILRSPSGQLSTDLAMALGVNQELLNSNNYRAYQRLRVVGGWNRKWGLPLPQAWALQAGSVFCFPAAAVDEKALQAFVERGIGERRAEGFGRIALNWHTIAELERYKITKTTPSEPPALSARSKELAQRMANRRLRATLEEGLVDAIRMQAQGFKNLPSTSQLSSLRLAARQAWQENDLTVIVRHLESLKGAKTEWQKARIGGYASNLSLLEWVKKQCPLSQDDFNAKFALTEGLPAMAGITSLVIQELHVEFCARLVEGVMKLAIEEAKKERRE